MDEQKEAREADLRKAALEYAWRTLSPSGPSACTKDNMIAMAKEYLTFLKGGA